MCYTGECKYEKADTKECSIYKTGMNIFPVDAACEQPGFLDMPIVAEEGENE